jgi:hypothetical protein
MKEMLTHSSVLEMRWKKPVKDKYGWLCYTGYLEHPNSETGCKAGSGAGLRVLTCKPNMQEALGSIPGTENKINK